MGKMFEVEIIECTKYSMKGRVIEESLLKQPVRSAFFNKGQVTGIAKVSTAFYKRPHLFSHPLLSSIHVNILSSSTATTTIVDAAEEVARLTKAMTSVVQARRIKMAVRAAVRRPKTRQPNAWI